jgi:hypothetical protein
LVIEHPALVVVYPGDGLRTSQSGRYGTWWKNISTKDALPFDRVLAKRLSGNIGWLRALKANPAEQRIVVGAGRSTRKYRRVYCRERLSKDSAKHSEMTPDQMIQRRNPVCRGRGGAGFPTGRKWKFVRMAKGDKNISSATPMNRPGTSRTASYSKVTRIRSSKR